MTTIVLMLASARSDVKQLYTNMFVKRKINNKHAVYYFNWTWVIKK